MKPLLTALFLVGLPILSSTVYAEKAVGDIEILAQRGKGVVTQAAFVARADKIPKKFRLAALRDGNRVEDVLNTLLLRAQLAADARESGFDMQQIVIDRMQLAAQAELAEAWLQHYVEMQPNGDYEQLANEYYQLNQESMLTSARIDVSHILLSTENRSKEEAKELADSIRQQLSDNPEVFDELVMKYSDDPSVSSNNGKFLKVKKGDMTKAFESAAFALQPTEISYPVITNYGYHIIRLDAHIPPEKMSFEEVKDQLIEIERNQHQERIKGGYLSGLTSLDVKMTKEALEDMVESLFGDNYVDNPVRIDETE